jgi:hypothetical protein
MAAMKIQSINNERLKVGRDLAASMKARRSHTYRRMSLWVDAFSINQIESLSDPVTVFEWVKDPLIGGWTKDTSAFANWFEQILEKGTYSQKLKAVSTTSAIATSNISSSIVSKLKFAMCNKTQRTNECSWADLSPPSSVYIALLTMYCVVKATASYNLSATSILFRQLPSNNYDTH